MIQGGGQAKPQSRSNEEEKNGTLRFVNKRKNTFSSSFSLQFLRLSERTLCPAPFLDFNAVSGYILTDLSTPPDFTTEQF